MQKKIHVFTSAALNYIPKARVLFESVRKNHPDWILHLALADELRGDFDLSKEPFDNLITLDSLEIPDYKAWAFTHRIVELATAIKPFALLSLLRREDCDAVIYLDPDIVVFSPLNDIVYGLNHENILLVPHQTDPENDIAAVIDNEIGSLKHGTYNLGFLGVSATQESKRFANWWGERLYYFCRDDICNGLFTDQKWIDLVPAFFDGVGIIRSTRHNVATWNLTTRKLTGNFEHGFAVDGEPLGFYHFTGFDKGDHHLMALKNAYGNKSVEALLRWYANRIGELGLDPLCRVPWFFSEFSNGEPIEHSHRLVYRERVDLQRAFPDPLDANGFLKWWKTQGRKEYPDFFDSNRTSAAIERLKGNLSPGYRPHGDKDNLISIGKLIAGALRSPTTTRRVAIRGLQVLKSEGVSGVLRRLRRF